MEPKLKKHYSTAETEFALCFATLIMMTRLLTDLATTRDQMDKKAALSLLCKTVYMLDGSLVKNLEQ